MNEQEHILTAVLECPRSDLYLKMRDIRADQQERIDEIHRRRAAGEPLQYILGEWEFFGLTFWTDPRALIPRPETELLVEQCTRIPSGSAQPLRLLDIGTGCGNIAVSLACHFSQARVTAIDVSADALDLARKNAARHHVEDRVRFLQADLFHFLSEDFADSEKFDMIITNPPYIPAAEMEGLSPEVRREPWEALYGGIDGLKLIRAIIPACRNALKSGGRLAFEFGDGQRKALEGLFQAAGVFTAWGFIKDYSGTDRICIAQTDGKTDY